MLKRRCPESGYRGQRFEVRAKRPPEIRRAECCVQDPAAHPNLCVDCPHRWGEFVVGWTNQEDGSALVRMVNLHPVWKEPRVLDLGEDEWKREPAKGM